MANPTQNNLSKKIEFIQYHQPALKDGQYSITVKHSITVKQKISDDKIDLDTSFAVTKNFTVAGERFSLKPTDIHGVFPPAGSLGDRSNVLPHIILNRSTLPWERQANQNDEMPWLALLLFTDKEQPKTQIITLEELKNSNSYSAKFPKITLENGQHNKDKITVIDVKQKLLSQITPSAEDLKYLAHVRQGTDDDGNLVGDELAVVICNRLPEKNGTSVVHLVSLEGRYNQNTNKGTFDFQGATDNDNVRLVSLKSWRFACVSPKHTFKELVNNLQTGLLRLPTNIDPKAEAYLQAKAYLAMGYLPLPHLLRQGGKTFSWYHSPLATGENPNKNNIELPIRAADELIRYDPQDGLFDVSYAAAWELGRLLALQSKHFSTSLFNWKRQHQQGKIIQNTEHHLPFYNEVNTDLPEAIASWFRDLSLLKGIPFNYLVPDEQMLPVESIRFFYLDYQWIECLLDGAFSIGRVTSSDLKCDRDRCNNGDNLLNNPHSKVTGILLRSEVVAGFPGLLVDGYAQRKETKSLPPKPLPLLRMERLSKNVLLCLFAGEIKKVAIHQKPETIHFGLDVDNDGKFSKTLKDENGRELKDKDGNKLKIDNIPWNDDESHRVIDIKGLQDNIATETKFKPFTSAQFALEMIEGIEKVKFVMN